jgi:hypothetical protein
MIFVAEGAVWCPMNQVWHLAAWNLEGADITGRFPTGQIVGPYEA